MNIKFKLIPTVIVFFSFSILIMLGFWQLSRLKQKQDLITEINKNTLKQAELLPLDLQALSENEFKKYKVKGRFAEEKDLFLYGYNYANPRAHGLHILTPFLTSDGRYILVNRGWSSGKNSPDSLPKKTASEHEIEIITMMLPKVKRGLFLPKNLPEKNLWLATDLEEMKEFLLINIHTGFLMTMIDENTDSVSEYHILLPKCKDFIRVNYSQHIYYAITWFSIAFILLIVAYFRAKDSK